MSFGLFSFGLLLAGAIDDYDANHSLSPIRQTRVAKTALFVIRPVFQTGAVGLLLRLRDDKSRRYCAAFDCVAAIALLGPSSGARTTIPAHAAAAAIANISLIISTPVACRVIPGAAAVQRSLNA